MAHIVQIRFLFGLTFGTSKPPARLGRPVVLQHTWTHRMLLASHMLSYVWYQHTLATLVEYIPTWS